MYLWGRIWVRGGRDLFGVIPIRSDTGYMTGGGVNGKGAQHKQDTWKIHVNSLEVQGRYTTGVSKTTTEV